MFYYFKTVYSGKKMVYFQPVPKIYLVFEVTETYYIRNTSAVFFHEDVFISLL